MGYFVVLKHSTMLIPERDDVLYRLKRINKAWHSLKRGFTYPGNQKWFSWMSENYDETVTSVKEVFEELRFETTYRNIDGVKYVDLLSFDSKQGQENLFLAAVSDCVKEGSCIEFLGEDGLIITYTVKEGRLMNNGQPVVDRSYDFSLNGTT